MIKRKVAWLIIVPIAVFAVAITVYYLLSIYNSIYSSGAGIFW